MLPRLFEAGDDRCARVATTTRHVLFTHSFVSCYRLIQLFCVIIGHGKVFSVSVDASDSVFGLKEAILKKKSRAIDCNTDELSLYAATMLEGFQWLATDDPRCSSDIRALRAGRTTARLEAMLTEELELDPTFNVSDYFDQDTPTRRVIHLLITMPSV